MNSNVLLPFHADHEQGFHTDVTTENLRETNEFTQTRTEMPRCWPRTIEDELHNIDEIERENQQISTGHVHQKKIGGRATDFNMISKDREKNENITDEAHQNNQNEENDQNDAKERRWFIVERVNQSLIHRWSC